MWTQKKDNNKNIKIIDLFCGVGWLTHWFVKEWFDVVVWIDFEKSCEYGYVSNNKWAEYLCMDINNVESDLLNSYYGDNCDIKVLVGCAPCQPFSLMNTNKSQYFNNEDVEKKSPIRKFADLISELKPEIVSMENVAWLMDIDKYPSFAYFLKVLKDNGYWDAFYKVVDCTKYWIPQTRKRLVLLASRLWPIELIEETHIEPITVMETIWKLPAINDWEICNTDPLHRSRKLSKLNKNRISSMPKNGWNLLDIDPSLIPDCHKKKSGKSYLPNVYARMRWDRPAPTMTTWCTWFGNGRFWHPEQNRAISLREAAMIQTFPKDYQFFEKNQSTISIQKISKHIGNAVPVKLGEVIAKSIKKHLSKYK